MIKLLNSNPLLAVIATILFTAVFWAWSYSTYFSIVTQGSMPLYTVLIKALPQHITWVYVCFAALLTLYQALYLNFILLKHEVLPKNTWIFAPIYVLLMCLIPQFLTFNPLLVSVSLIVWAFDKILKTYKSNNALALTFDIGLLIGLASLIYFPTILMCLLFAVGVLLLKPFAWRDWLVFALGLLLPFYFLFTYYFITDQWDLIAFQSNHFQQTLNWQQLIPKDFGITVGLIFTLLLLSLLSLISNFNKSVIKVRNTRQVTLSTGIIAVLMLLVSKQYTPYQFTVLCMPLAFLFTFYFINTKRNWIGESFFWLLLANLVYNYIG